jgi:hypothetical protein
MDAARRTRREAKPKLDVGARVARLFSDGWHVGIIEALSAAATASVRFDDGQLIHSMRLDGMHAVPDDEALAAFIASDLAKKKPLADAQVAAMEAKRKRKAQTTRRVLSRWMQLWREQKGKTLDLSVLLAAEEGAQFAMFDRAEIISTEWRKVIVQRILEPEVGFVLHDVHGVVLDEVDTPKGVLLDAHDIEGMPYAYGQYYNFVEGGAEAVPPSPFSPPSKKAREEEPAHPQTPKPPAPKPLSPKPPSPKTPSPDAALDEKKKHYQWFVRRLMDDANSAKDKLRT